MKGNKFYLDQYSFENFTHGGVGYTDAEKLMNQNGFIPISFPEHYDFSIVAKFQRVIYFLKMVFRINAGSTVIFIFPVFARLHRLLLRFLLLKKDIRLICFISDIDGIKDGNNKFLAKELNQLRYYEYFIVHNDAMKLWLENNMPAKKITVIEFFDFLAVPFDGDRQNGKQIVFAGNLAKSTFLESLYLLKEKSPDLHFNLYGTGYTEKMKLQENVSYEGVAEPYQMPAVVQGSFGLVWDGDSVDLPGGSLGEYMRYISHHKLSLYILSGLPLIVSEIAASASLVKKYKIGIVIHSLYEINDAIEKISEEDYKQMRKNIKSLAEKISTGGQLSTAITQLMSNDIS